MKCVIYLRRTYRQNRYYEIKDDTDTFVNVYDYILKPDRHTSHDISFREYEQKMWFRMNLSVLAAKPFKKKTVAIWCH